MVNGKLPGGVAVVDVIVSVEDPDVTDGGLKLAVTPDGSPLALKVTAPANPPDGLAVAVYVVPAPAVTVRVAGDTDSEKSAADTAVHPRMAVLTLSRPPVTRRPVSNGIASTLLNRLVFSSDVFRAQCESTSAAAPETCGAAIDVPLKY
jgi:hypothetical protein